MTVKIEDIRVGDEVLVRLTYAGQDKGGIYLGLDANSIAVRVLADRITQHIPRKIKVGDKVRVKFDKGGREYEVVSDPRTPATGFEQVSLWNGHYGFTWSYLSDLERVP